MANEFDKDADYAGMKSAIKENAQTAYLAKEVATYSMLGAMIGALGVIMEGASKSLRLAGAGIAAVLGAVSVAAGYIGYKKGLEAEIDSVELDRRRSATNLGRRDQLNLNLNHNNGRDDGKRWAETAISASENNNLSR